MTFPQKPTCHDESPFLTPEYAVWRPAGPTRDDGQGMNLAYRSCGYCGSIHPEDLLAALKSGSTLGGADWKYGYPHKFYVKGGAVDWAKWYNAHLEDAGYDDEAWQALADALEQHAGIHFERKEDGVYYRAPFHGYQR